MRPRAAVPFLFVLASLLACAAPAAAQGFRPASKPRPWSRVTFFSNLARTNVDGVAPKVRGELSTSFSYQLPEGDDAGADYGVDVRYGTFVGIDRPARTSIYEGFAGVRLFSGRLRVRGAGALVVANHVSWLDIFALDATQAMRFVAKAEIARWPVLGWLVAHVGTVFVDRRRRHHIADVNRAVKQGLGAGDVFAVFPEGAVGNGSVVHAFHASALQPAIACGATVHPVEIGRAHV